MTIAQSAGWGILGVRSLALCAGLVASCVSRQPVDEKAKSEASQKLKSELEQVTPEKGKRDSLPATDEPCPPLRLFKNISDLCARGIMPLSPLGDCHRVQAEDSSAPHGVGFATVEVAALGGIAELVERTYVDADGTDTADVYLALKTDRGYVLLSEVVKYWAEVGLPPKGEVFEGSALELTLQVSQELSDPDPGQTVVTKLHCSGSLGGEIRCGGKCPSLAVEDGELPLDCPSIAAYSWSSLPAGNDVTLGWGGYYDEQRLGKIQKFLAVQGKRVDHPQVVLVREVEVRSRFLTIVKLKNGTWVLIHDQVPLLASKGEIRVGEGPGGVFVSSYAATNHRSIHRLSLSTHDLELVVPGTCDDPTESSDREDP